MRDRELSDMDTRKVLSGLCYFSIFFAGFIFPLVVFLVSGDEMTKMNAKKALLSHLIPIIPALLLVFAALNDFSIGHEIPVFTIICVVILILTIVVVFIWNIIKGVKVLLAE
jgi:hypothetical protein